MGGEGQTSGSGGKWAEDIPEWEVAETAWEQSPSEMQEAGLQPSICLLTEPSLGQAGGSIKLSF